MSRLLRLREDQWVGIKPLLPPQHGTRGRPPKPHRPMLEAMIWVLRTGAPWRDLPPVYGPWQSVYTRFSRWSKSGVWQRLLEALAEEHDDEGYLIDATIVRAHQDASGAEKRGARRRSGARAASAREPESEARRTGPASMSTRVARPWSAERCSTPCA